MYVGDKSKGWIAITRCWGIFASIFMSLVLVFCNGTTHFLIFLRMTKKNVIRFTDLGLSTPVPQVLSTSKGEKKKKRLEVKSERNLRTKEAEKQLSLAREKVEKHKEYVKSEACAKQKEKAEKRKALNDMRVSLHERRENEEKLQKQRVVSSQQEYISKLVANIAEEEGRTRQVREAIDRDTLDLAKFAPQSVCIHVKRHPHIELTRKELPVLREEQAIVEAINSTSRTCVLICGETGSGKTTQIPQFLWECGYGDPKGSPFGREGCILVTEPRRVAAISMARRVAEELNVPFGEDVCYQVRYDNNLSDGFKIKFATEGIVLKEIQSDFLLRKYSVIIVDEAHERSVTGDILIGMLSRIMPTRNDLYLEELRKNGGLPQMTTLKPLKLVIMSATMRVADFRDNRKLFPVPPPFICVEARRFPVTNHFSKRTELFNYVDEAFRKVCQIHKKLPPGGILVFLSTQYEIGLLCDRLLLHYAKTKIEYCETSYSKHALLTSELPTTPSESDESESDIERDEFGLATEDYALDKDDTELENCNIGRKRCRNAAGSPEKAEGFADESEVNGELNTLHVLPLYALMNFSKQQEVFQQPPAGKRLCVVATNVAETSITIPNIRYVVDSGRVKTKTVDESTCASCFRIEWTSQASAEQRSGRAGRVAPGHCYRLYSTAVYSNLMPKHSAPEILRTSLESVVLLMKHFGINHVGTFPFPSPPKEADLKRALTHLGLIGALNSDDEFRITATGRRLVAYPIPPRFSRVIVEGIDRKLPRFLITLITLIASIFSTTTSVFTDEGHRIKWKSKDISDDEKERKQRLQALLHPGSDLLTSLNALLVYMNNSSAVNCDRYCLVQKSLSEAKQLGDQLLVLASRDTAEEPVEGASDADVVGPEQLFEERALAHLSKNQEIVIRKLFIIGLVDQVARRATVQECRSHGVEYKSDKTTKTPYITVANHIIVYVHPSSSIARTYPPPEYVTFVTLQKNVRSETKESLTLMLGLTIVTKEWLHECAVTVE
ncbi:pre-mRNA splicing factor ATP-dependent RNA helicase, putative [Trypanosoma brucei brucei TREU927]|uniref:RNA helicase n=1 Tax=Trypanosoma brucei brucei (strain 927/4 GUTat10.1) TaxID=185431 RepID=Q587C6_TRYB2|nr:pre-mRNA splicing factor ATP-dependent RNA helicase, putative [Trypanosoma brucei brucei TREU927]AAX79251.1 pre-mRNA splicing factor ATP-dependent RNA helicase, putative [Trypanosoma brucei]AAZ12018.1 pre-mRNA splicing factor ATP-dependent RNA helicase, putative [Trypanosoma brucei brucei TREU927]